MGALTGALSPDEPPTAEGDQAKDVVGESKQTVAAQSLGVFSALDQFRKARNPGGGVLPREDPTGDDPARGSGRTPRADGGSCIGFRVSEGKGISPKLKEELFLGM
jgi:hypothetical protein